MKTKEDLRKEQVSAVLEFVTTELLDMDRGVTKWKRIADGKCIGLMDSCSAEIILDGEDESTTPQMNGVEMTIEEAIEIFRELEVPVYEDDSFHGGELAK